MISASAITSNSIKPIREAKIIIVSMQVHICVAKLRYVHVNIPTYYYGPRIDMNSNLNIV